MNIEDFRARIHAANECDCAYTTLFTPEAEELLAEIDRLRCAIRKHRDQRGDDRCWLDDEELYKALGEPFDIRGTDLPSKCEFLKSCERYWEQRQTIRGKVNPVGSMTIAQLEAELDRLRALDAEKTNLIRELMEHGSW